MANSTLFFHETFQPEGCVGDKYKISELTGIPTGQKKGKVEPHIRYAKYMGLLDYCCTRGL